MICLYIREFVKAKMLNMKLSNICGKESEKKRTREYYNELEYINVITRWK